MIRKIYLFPLFLLALSFVACNETKEENKYANWRERNDMFMDSLQRVFDSNTDPELERVQDERNRKSYIYFKRKVSGPTHDDVTGEKILPPYYNSTVTIHYRGMYINEAVFAKATPPYYYTKLYNDPDINVFDQTFKGDDPDENFDKPYTSYVNKFVDGFTEVLQKMIPGDRFEVYIPYESGYGANNVYNDYGALIALGGSTLIFDLKMVRIDDYYYHR